MNCNEAFTKSALIAGLKKSKLCDHIQLTKLDLPTLRNYINSLNAIQMQTIPIIVIKTVTKIGVVIICKYFPKVSDCLHPHQINTGIEEDELLAIISNQSASAINKPANPYILMCKNIVGNLINVNINNITEIIQVIPNKVENFLNSDKNEKNANVQPIVNEKNKNDDLDADAEDAEDDADMYFNVDLVKSKITNHIKPSKTFSNEFGSQHSGGDMSSSLFSQNSNTAAQSQTNSIIESNGQMKNKNNEIINNINKQLLLMTTTNTSAKSSLLIQNDENENENGDYDDDTNHNDDYETNNNDTYETNNFNHINNTKTSSIISTKSNTFNNKSQNLQQFEQMDVDVNVNANNDIGNRNINSILQTTHSSSNYTETNNNTISTPNTYLPNESINEEHQFIQNDSQSVTQSVSQSHPKTPSLANSSISLKRKRQESDNNEFELNNKKVARQQQDQRPDTPNSYTSIASSIVLSKSISMQSINKISNENDFDIFSKIQPQQQQQISNNKKQNDIIINDTFDEDDEIKTNNNTAFVNKNNKMNQIVDMNEDDDEDCDNNNTNNNTNNNNNNNDDYDDEIDDFNTNFKLTHNNKLKQTLNNSDIVVDYDDDDDNDDYGDDDDDDDEDLDNSITGRSEYSFTKKINLKNDINSVDISQYNSVVKKIYSGKDNTNQQVNDFIKKYM